MCKLYQSSTCAVYRQVVLTAQILLKAGWHARLLLKFASSRLRKKKAPLALELRALCNLPASLQPALASWQFRANIPQTRLR